MTAQTQGEHPMTMLFRKEIDKLTQMLMNLGALVEQNVQQAVQALKCRDLQLAERIICKDALVDQMEVDIEEECQKVLALHQPVANDLRYIITILKVNGELERIGDIAVNVSKRARNLAAEQDPCRSFDFSEISEKAGIMLRKSLEALVNLDDALAYEVCAADEEVNMLKRNFVTEVKAAIRHDPERLDALLQVFAASRHLERIADHATNIAEDVIYLIKGDIVRHKMDEHPK